MDNSEIKQVEREIEGAKARIEFGAAIERLRENRDFKKVFMEGYFEHEAVRLVHLKADPGMQTSEKQASIVSQIDAIGTVVGYLSTQLQLAKIAANSLPDFEEVHSQLLGEEAGQ